MSEVVGVIGAGTMGGGISGSGPSMFMLSKDVETAKAVGLEMALIYSETLLRFNTHISEIYSKGIRFI